MISIAYTHEYRREEEDNGYTILHKSCSACILKLRLNVQGPVVSCFALGGTLLIKHFDMNDKAPRKHDLADKAAGVVSQNILFGVDEDDVQELIGAHERADENSIIGGRDTECGGEQRLKCIGR